MAVFLLPNITPICHFKAIRILHQIHIDAKTSRVYKYRPEGEQIGFAPGTTFIPHQKVANSGLDFVNFLCTQSEQYLPILMEKNRNHQTILDKGKLGYSALDILDFERPKYQIKDCFKMVDCILSENDQYTFLSTTLNTTTRTRRARWYTYH